LVKKKNAADAPGTSNLEVEAFDFESWDRAVQQKPDVEKNICLRGVQGPSVVLLFQPSTFRKIQPRKW
jgi:hypothetical protein